MKLFLTTILFMTTIAQIASDKKLRLINGLNGGLLTGVNGVNPVLMGGLNTPLLPGGPAVLGQPPQVGQAAALPSYAFQPFPVGAAPFGPVNLGPQLASPYFPPNMGLPYYFGGPQNQPGIIPPQPQVGAGQNPGNPQAAPPPCSLNRFKRSFSRRITARPPVSVTRMPATVPANTVG